VDDFESFVGQVKRGHHNPLLPPLSSPSGGLAFECECAVAISNLCESLSINIPILQPLRGFENFESDDALLQALDDAERWFRLARCLGTDLVLVCSNFIEGPFPLKDGDEGTTRNMVDYLDAQAHAFRMLGQRAQMYGIRIGYEPLAWGTVVNRWEQCWAVVKKANMPNVGIILDSFNCLCVLVSSSGGCSDFLSGANNTQILLCHLESFHYHSPRLRAISPPSRRQSPWTSYFSTK
jgi:4-hydroxyphenylpyruvate dioxygenase